MTKTGGRWGWTVLGLGLAIAFQSARAEAQPGGDRPVPPPPERVTLAPSQVFVPSGFDDNDNAQVVFSGNLPSTCFQAGPATARLEADAHRIVLKTDSWYHPSDWCLFVVVPYWQAVDLGPVPAGDYQVVAELKSGETRKMGALSVAVSRNAGPDDRLYAPVEEVRVDRIPGDGGRGAEVVLKGAFPSSCMSLEDVQVVQRSRNVIELLPLARLRQGEDCRPAPVAFETRLRIQSAWKGRTLIHARSLNGKAVNAMVDFD